MAKSRWQNFNSETGEKYKDFDDYLSLFKSKRRMQIKRERRGVYEEEVINIFNLDSNFNCFY